MTRTRILVIGGAGRLGSAICAATKNSSVVEIVATPARGEKLDATNSEVIIDVSHADATSEILAAKKPLVIGTTGHSEAQLQEMARASKNIPIVLAPNFSVGVNALFQLVRDAARMLGPEFDLEIVEMHHRLKKDAPSGTAKKLAEILGEARQLPRNRALRHGREGMVGERSRDEIGIHALRGGDVVGEHTVVFAGDGERLELTHKASSRETFARGALRAAQWVVRQKPGLYGMSDVIAAR